MKRNAVALLLIGALACTDSNAPAPAPAVHQFDILPAGATVAAGFPVIFVAQREDSTVDAWRVSDSSAARIDSTGRGWALVQTLAAGTVTITATRLGDSGQATLVILPPPPPPPDTTHHASFAISPALDTVTVGQMVSFVRSNANVGTAEWSLSDSVVAQFGSAYQSSERASVVGRAAGTVTITCTHEGETARATLVIREPKPGEWESIDLGRVDSATNARAIAITDDGTIIGSLEYLGKSFFSRGFIYKNGSMRKLPSQDGSDIPQVIGPSGKIAGMGRGVAVWDTPDALPRHLALEPGESGGVVGVNQRGDVLFTAETTLCVGPPGSSGRECYPGGSRAALWRDGDSVGLGSLGDSTVVPWTVAHAWNAKGQIVGGSQVRNRPVSHGYQPEFFHPFLWENGVMRDLGVLAPSPCLPEGTGTDCSWGEAMDINANGVVVGISNGRAVIWENGVIRDLGVDPGHYTKAIAINDRGQVLGISQTYGVFLWEKGQTQFIGLTLYATTPKLGPNGEVFGGTACTCGDAFFWQAGQRADLGQGGALAINGKGEVVGVSGRRAMLWRKKQ